MSKRKAATKNESTQLSDAVAQRELLSIERSKSLESEQKRKWTSGLAPSPTRTGASSKMPRSPWGRCGGNIVAVGLRQGKTARRDKKLKRHREQAAYEVRRTLPASIKAAN